VCVCPPPLRRDFGERGRATAAVATAVAAGRHKDLRGRTRPLTGGCERWRVVE